MTEIALQTTNLNLQTSLSGVFHDGIQFLQYLWKGVSYGIFVLDVLDEGKDFRYAAFNPAIARSSPIPVYSLVGKTITEALPDEMAQLYRQRYSECVQTQQSISFEERFCHNGQETWWLLTVNPIRTNSQQIDRLIVTAIDISEQKAALSDRQQAEKEQARLLAILEATSDFISTADRNGQVLYLNQAARQMLGLQQGESLADRNLTRNHPDWVNQLFRDRAFPEAIQTGSWMGETALLGIDGQEIPLSQLILAHKSETGEVEYFSTIARDISEYKRQENALRFIVEGMVSKTGEEFFHACVKHLAEISQVKYAFITELADETCSQSRMLALWTGEEFIEPYKFDLTGTPCDIVFKESWGIFPDALQARFPQASVLATLNAESYLGVVIVDSQGKAIGNIGIIDTKPLANDLKIAKSILQLFATRVGAEMERNAAEAKLHEKEEFLRTVYEGAIQPIFAIDVLPGNEFRYVGWNAAAEAASGMRSQDIRGKTPEEIYGVEAGKLERQRLQACLTLETSVSYEECLTFKDRESWWVTTHNPIKDSNGKIYRFIGTAFDITARKQAEKEQARLLAILEATSDFVGTCDPNGQVLYLNQAGREMLGLTPEDSIVHRNLTQTHPEWATQIILNQALPKTICSGSWLGETAILGKDGTEIPVSQLVLAHRSDTGEIEYFSTIARDISDRKVAEAVLNEYADRQTLLNQLANQIRHSLDLDTVIATTIQSIRDLLDIDSCAFIWYNPDAESPTWDLIQEAKLEDFPSHLGSYPIALVGPIDQLLFNQELLRIDDVKQYEEPIHQAFLNAVRCQSEVLLPIHTHSHRIGALVCVHYRQVRPWTDSEIELLKAVGDQLAIAIDQAELYAESRAKSQELQKTLQELQRTQAKMVLSEKMSSLGQLVAGIAHEINNPVGFIHGNVTHVGDYAQNLLDLIALYQQIYPKPTPAIANKIEDIELEFISEDLPKLLTSMKVGTERIREIVKSLRIFSRLDESEVKLVDIHDGIESTLTILQNRLKAQSNRFPIQIVKEYGNLPEVECFPGQLNQVFMNILANAIDAFEESIYQNKLTENPTIAIRTERCQNHRIRIAIADNGAGIPEAIQQRLFDPFFTTKPVGKGTGLGLSISYQIITEKHRGNLLFQSKPGQETEFIIEIPMRQNIR